MLAISAENPISCCQSVPRCYILNIASTIKIIRDTIRQEVLMKELGVNEIFLDKASGKNTNRPELQRMLEYVRQGDTVIVESVSRFARNTRDLLVLVEKLSEKHVEFVSKKEAIDTTTPSGKFMLTIFGAVAELEREYIHINKAVEYHGNVGKIVPRTKSEAGMRDIIIRKKLMDKLPKRKKTGLLFPGKGGGITKGEFIEWWGGLNLGVTPHQLRHAYVTDLYEAGVDAEVAMTQTGHSDIKTMRGIYTHIHGSQKVKVTALLDDYDSGPDKKQ